MKAALILTISVAALVTGCVHVPTPPVFIQATPELRSEYDHFLTNGTCVLTGQAFLVQMNGNTVRAAGRTVTMDPATTIGADWWNKAGKIWYWRYDRMMDPIFFKARRSTVADADGRFKFSDLPPGDYYVRTEVTWSTPVVDFTGAVSSSQQGGVVGRMVTVSTNQVDVILSDLAR